MTREEAERVAAMLVTVKPAIADVGFDVCKEIADLEAQRKRLRDAVRRAEKGAVPRG